MSTASESDQKPWEKSLGRLGHPAYPRRCPGCGEKVTDGCLPGCTDRD
jgi:hypothetical protein